MSDSLIKDENDAYAAMQQRAVQSIINSLRHGNSKHTALERAIEIGLPTEQAEPLVNAIYAQVESEKPNAQSYALAALTGLITAGVAAWAWAEITVMTGYNIGIVAIGVGWLIGWSIDKVTRGKRGIGLAIVAALFAILGVFAGKYLTFYLELIQYLTENSLLLESKPMFWDPTVITFFKDSVTDLFDAFDIFWFGLAAYVAFRKLKSAFE